ncbi:TonB-dependent receptor [Aestuariibacter sp. A3R04]|uniref:TonB-dependent receptor n=1 Tax=Aestuariibacter sp. A3R04 TaxID=2841571 RepID=UPI001C085E10|nr:TonB-dependent receptor [Aestuariibacter sp. A3R04]MBU3023479.1 TonB-dependent receptor [Aestuariibacter sp. A3R04]
MGHKFSKITLAVLSATTLSTAISLNAQELQDENADVEVIEVSGIRQSLTSALAEKRSSDNLIEVIQAVDIGKLPDQNLAEVLENVTGIQITRTAGVGTGVQIRGTNANRTEINGVSTVGSGSGRGGISFEDVNASIIAAVEVTKSPEAKTIEGSVGGTVNLRTIRPLELTDTLGNIRVQAEDSSLTTDGAQPRISGAFGKNWETDNGKFGFVISGSYTEQEATSFRPRVDRDGGLVENVNADVYRGGELQSVAPAAQEFDFVGVQFLNQELENYEYETKNLAASFEWAPTENTKFYFDAILNDQERRQDSSRVQGSGVSAVLNYNVPTAFETVNFGSLDGVDLGSIAVATQGTIEPNLGVDDDDPNLRFSSDTGARITDSKIFRLGGEWQGDNLFASVEIATSTSDTVNPNLSTTLNFINPNCPLDATSNDNCVPFAYDLTGGSLAFGVNFDSAYAPSVADLLDPNNVVLDAVTVGRDTTENSEDAFRADFTYFFDFEHITSVDFGYRYNKTSSTFNDVGSSWGQSRMANSPNGSLFAELLVAGPDNFGSADGRELAFRNFLLVDPDRSFNDPDGTFAILQQAVEEHGGSDPLDAATVSSSAFFDIEETTHALYAQANFEYGMFRGNFGARYLQTDIDSLGNSVADGEVTEVVTSGDYDYLLPRINIVANPHDDVLVRLGWGKDIRRPDFNDLSTSVSFGTGPNTAVNIGNPGLEPEEVTSFDIGVEWYFAEAAVVSAGYFHKKRTNLFVTQIEDAEVDGNGYRDITPPCEGGGIFNPLPDRNVLSDVDGNGLCVPISTIINDSGSTTQQGFEFAVQYDLSSFEDDLGWASGFGISANYTIQEFSGGDATNTSATRGTDIFNAINGVYDDSEFVTYESVQGLLDFSENAYNVTVFYEKFGLSARMRYTWRDSFRTLDTAGGATLNSTLGFPVVTHDRGQLNASVNYDVTDKLNVGIEAINLTKSDVTQSCVNEGALLCFQGLTDRRLTLGASYRF